MRLYSYILLYALSLHTRIPVYKGTRDNLVGFIYAEDILKLVLDDINAETVNVQDLLHQPVIVPPTKKIDEMFDYFLEHKIQAVAILNEFGGIDGLITLKRVLNFVFGKIMPESTSYQTYEIIDDNTYDVSGEMKLTLFEDITHFGITDPRMTTISGVVLRALDRLPGVGDEVIIEGVVLTVLEMKGHRISKLRATKSLKQLGD